MCFLRVWSWCFFFFCNPHLVSSLRWLVIFYRLFSWLFASQMDFIRVEFCTCMHGNNTCCKQHLIFKLKRILCTLFTKEEKKYSLYQVTLICMSFLMWRNSASSYCTHVGDISCYRVFYLVLFSIKIGKNILLQVLVICVLRKKS